MFALIANTKGQVGLAYPSLATSARPILRNGVARGNRLRMIRRVTGPQNCLQMAQATSPTGNSLIVPRSQA
jgi:hypothetical protein